MLSKRLNSNLGNIKTFNTLMGGFATNTIKRPDLFGMWYNAMHLEGEAIAHAVDAWYNPKKTSSEGFKEVFPTFYENLINLFEETVNAR